MSTKSHVSVRTPRSRTAIALAVSTALWGSYAVSADKTMELEEVIVTGSLISGTPEDAALPVETITFEEMQEMGNPTNLELVKAMSEVGQVAGEADRYNSFPIGAATVNLRNLGQRFTTVIFNGRRFPEQFSPVTGRFNNIAWIPNAAVGSVEVLKGGGAVTYGADAVAGVVNYKTRKTLDGIEANVDYRYIDDSDGDYGANILWGTQLERGNILVSGSYAHRSTIHSWDRPWAHTPYYINNSTYNWMLANNPGSYSFNTTPTTTISPIATGANRYTGDRHMSAGGTVRDPNCTSGSNSVAAWSGTPTPACLFNGALFENIVEEQDTTNLYVEFNYDLTDWLEYSSEYMVTVQRLPSIAMHPSDGPLAFPTGQTSAYWVPGANPAVGNFLQNFLNSNGTTAFTPAQIAAIRATGRANLPLGVWRPFAIGGNPIYGRYDPQENSTDFYRTTQALGGDIGDSGLRWDMALTYNYVKDRREARDMLTDRLQAALNGFGGPNCTGTVAGANGCQWFNPFPSAFSNNYYTGEANPSYVPGLENSIDLVKWLYVPIWLQRDYRYFVADATVTGKTGWELPGGAVAIAVGAQYRRATEETTLADIANRDISPANAIAFTRNDTVLGATREDSRKFPVYAAYAEAQLPLLENVTLQLAGRYEKFISDLTDRDNDVFVPAASIRWQTTDWMAIRGAWGQTFSQVNPPSAYTPTPTNSNALPDFGSLGGDAATRYVTYNYPNLDVQPMKGEYFNVGFLFDAGNFRGSLDFYDIKVNDFTRTMIDDNVVSGLVMPGETGQTALINCSSNLLSTPEAELGGNPFVILNGPCVQGTSRLNSAAGGGGLIGGVVNFWGGRDQTNAGTLHNRGIDLSMSYAFDNVFGGELRPSIDASYILDWNLDDFVVVDETLAPGYDGIGYVNGSTGRIGQSVPEWRATFGLNYRLDIHNLNIAVRFIPGITDEETTKFGTSNLATNTNIGNAALVSDCSLSGIATPPVPAGAGTAEFGGTGSRPGTVGFCNGQVASLLAGQEIEDYLTVDMTYRVLLPAETALSLSIYNVLDEDPSFARTSVSYMSGFGNPLGRNYKLTLSKKF